MNDIAREFQHGQERLARDLRAVVDDAEQLLRHAVRDAGEGYEEARDRLEHTISAAKAELVTVERALLAKAEGAARATDQYVRGHPWESIGIGAGIGLLAGLLLARK